MAARLYEGTWVLIADGEKALFLVNQGNAREPSLSVVSKEVQDNPPTRDQVSDDRGRTQQGANDVSSAYAITDWHRLAKERFARELADMLYEQAHRNEFKRLVICASRPVLSELRQHMHAEVTQRVIAEIPKVLTRHTIPDATRIIVDALDAVDATT